MVYLQNANTIQQTIYSVTYAIDVNANDEIQIKSLSTQRRPLVALIRLLCPIAFPAPTLDRNPIDAGALEFLVRNGPVFAAWPHGREVLGNQPGQHATLFGGVRDKVN